MDDLFLPFPNPNQNHYHGLPHLHRHCLNCNLIRLQNCTLNHLLHGHHLLLSSCQSHGQILTLPHIHLSQQNHHSLLLPLQVTYCHVHSPTLSHTPRSCFHLHYNLLHCLYHSSLMTLTADLDLIIDSEGAEVDLSR